MDKPCGIFIFIGFLGELWSGGYKYKGVNIDIEIE